MKILVDNIYSFLITDDTELKKALEKKYSAKIPGYKYTKQYKSRGWDGTKKFFSSRTGRFGSGILSSIIEDLAYLNRDYTVEDNRTPSPALSPYLSGIEYRDYQKELVEMALEHRGCIVKSPTGSGKTIVLGGILKALEDRTGLIFFTKKQLLLQTYEWLKGQGFDVGIAFGDGVDIKPITLCTSQSIHKVTHTHLNTSEFIIFDEVHEFSKGKLATKIIKSFPKATYRIGMTATVPKERLALMNLRSFLGPVLSEVDVLGLVEEGFLTPPEVHFQKMPEYKDHSLLNTSYQEVYDSYITNNTTRNEKIENICKGISVGKVLILVKNLKHLETLKTLIPESLSLEGKDDLTTRKSTIQKFVSRKKSILIGTTIMQTGIDIPEITHLINARGLKSEIATLQALGRALRIHDTKDKVYIYDFMDEVPYLNTHSKKRLAAYKSLHLEIKK